MGLARQIGAIGRWPLGMGLASWRYLWHPSALHRVDQPGTMDDISPPLPDRLVDQRVQRLEDGVGPLFRRRYGVRIEGSSMTPEQLITTIARLTERRRWKVAFSQDAR